MHVVNAAQRIKQLPDMFVQCTSSWHAPATCSKDCYCAAWCYSILCVLISPCQLCVAIVFNKGALMPDNLSTWLKLGNFSVLQIEAVTNQAVVIILHSERQ